MAHLILAILVPQIKDQFVAGRGVQFSKVVCTIDAMVTLFHTCPQGNLRFTGDSTGGRAHSFPPASGVFQTRLSGHDHRTRGLLLLAPVPKVRGEILELATSLAQSAASGPQNKESESAFLLCVASAMKGEYLDLHPS